MTTPFKGLQTLKFTDLCSYTLFANGVGTTIFKCSTAELYQVNLAVNIRPLYSIRPYLFLVFALDDRNSHYNLIVT